MKAHGVYVKVLLRSTSIIYSRTVSYKVSFRCFKRNQCFYFLKMCKKFSSSKLSVSPLAVRLAKITVVLIFFFFAECAAGSCLSYGHACWGAHGKRSGSGSRSNLPLRDNNSGEDNSLSDSRWFLSRLIQNPAELRLWRGRDFMLPTNHRNVKHPFLSENYADNDLIKSQDDQDLSNFQDSPTALDSDYRDDIESPHFRFGGDKLRLYKVLKKNTPKELV